MSHDDQQPAPPAKTLGVIAQFPDANELVEAARRTTDEGYRKVDAHSPFPIHGIDAALRAPNTILPWVVFFGGLAGCLTGVAIQYYMNAVEFPFIYSGYAFEISAKPLFGLPANVPIIFELIILFSALTSFFGMIALNGLPKLHNPLFYSERFSRATNDGFFLWVDARDDKFDVAATTDWLNSIGAQAVETVEEVVKGKEVPARLLAAGAIGAAIALVPPFWVAAAAGTSSQPRLSIWWDMDYQKKLKTQTATEQFADGRAMRVQVPGTVARGTLAESVEYQYGQSPSGGTAQGGQRGVRFVNFQTGGEGGDGAAPAAEERDEDLLDDHDWVDKFPLEQMTKDATLDEVMHRGQARFNIYCATCHGQEGYGDGLITERALSLNQGTWVKPLSLHDASVAEQPVGKIFSTISNGRRKMPGYRQQIPTKDRWAIALYVQALQRSQNASAGDLPEGQEPPG